MMYKDGKSLFIGSYDLEVLQYVNNLPYVSFKWQEYDPKNYGNHIKYSITRGLIEVCPENPLWVCISSACEYIMKCDGLKFEENEITFNMDLEKAEDK